MFGNALFCWLRVSWLKERKIFRLKWKIHSLASKWHQHCFAAMSSIGVRWHLRQKINVQCAASEHANFRIAIKYWVLQNMPNLSLLVTNLLFPIFLILFLSSLYIYFPQCWVKCCLHNIPRVSCDVRRAGDQPHDAGNPAQYRLTVSRLFARQDQTWGGARNKKCLVLCFSLQVIIMILLRSHAMSNPNI